MPRPRQPPHKRETLSQALSGNDDGLVWPDRLNCSVQEVTSPNRSRINMRCSKTKRRDRRTIHIATWFFSFCSWMHLRQTAIYGASEFCTADVFSSATKPRKRVHVTYSVEPISHSLVDGLFLHQRLCTSDTARDLTQNSQFCLLPTETTVSSFRSPMRRRQAGAFLWLRDGETRRIRSASCTFQENRSGNSPGREERDNGAVGGGEPGSGGEFIVMVEDQGVFRSLFSPSGSCRDTAISTTIRQLSTETVLVT